MPDTPSPTLIHFVTPGSIMPVCGAGSNDEWHNIPGRVTCFACRRTPIFLQEQWVGPPTPAPVLLKDVLAGHNELRDIVRDGLNAGSWDAEHESLVWIADLLGLHYNDETDTYS